MALARGQQSYDNGNFRQAATILEPLVTGRSGGAATPEALSAARLLAQIYHRSADYGAAVRAAERYGKWSAEPDADILLILADSELALGHTAAAREQLNQAVSALNKQAGSTVADPHCTIEAERIAHALRLATPGGLPGAATENRAAAAGSGPPGIRTSSVPQEPGFDIVTLTARHYLDTNRAGDAVALLKRATSSRSYGANESIDLRIQLADSYRRQSELYEASADTAAQKAAMECENRVLRSVEVDLAQRSDQGRVREDFLDVLARRGSLYEHQAELTLAAAQVRQGERGANPASALQQRSAQRLKDAARCYVELEARSKDMDRATRESLANANSNKAYEPGRAGQYLDMAL
ncbi:MAG TPA: hypothetical protein VFW73_06530, partial [Lacipirellulaceae bacterium]|nr:hypothetical protein [Lacipirellulaceae bacterium]